MTDEMPDYEMTAPETVSLNSLSRAAVDFIRLSETVKRRRVIGRMAGLIKAIIPPDRLGAFAQHSEEYSSAPPMTPEQVVAYALMLTLLFVAKGVDPVEAALISKKTVIHPDPNPERHEQLIRDLLSQVDELRAALADEQAES